MCCKIKKTIKIPNTPLEIETKCLVGELLCSILDESGIDSDLLFKTLCDNNYGSIYGNKFYSIKNDKLILNEGGDWNFHRHEYEDWKETEVDIDKETLESVKVLSKIYQSL